MFGIDFSLLRRSVDDMEKKAKGMQAELDDLHRQRERFLSAPGSKEDLKAMLTNWVTASADKYRESLRETLTKFARSPRNMTPHELVSVMSIAGMAQPGGEVIRTQDVDQALCALFGPLLNEALIKEIDSMEWHPNAITTAERKVSADKITARIDQLSTDLKDLTDAAEEAGVTWTR